MLWLRVTGGTLSVGRGLRIFMRIVARQARQLAFTLQETGALAQIDRLMPDIPGIVKIRRHALRRRHPVALPAQLIHLDGRECFGIHDVVLTGSRCVSDTRPMAGLAANPHLVRLNRTLFAESNFSG